jgi:hypothetical protein
VDGNDVLQASLISGGWLDEYILMNRNSTNYWYMESPIIGNVAALVNSNGAIQEGYTYRGYGQATVHTGAGNDGNWFTSDDATASASALGNPYLFTGRDWDSIVTLMPSTEYELKLKLVKPDGSVTEKLLLVRTNTEPTDPPNLRVCPVVPAAAEGDGPETHP